MAAAHVRSQGRVGNAYDVSELRDHLPIRIKAGSSWEQRLSVSPACCVNCGSLEEEEGAVKFPWVQLSEEEEEEEEGGGAAKSFARGDPD